MDIYVTYLTLDLHSEIVNESFPNLIMLLRISPYTMQEYQYELFPLSLFTGITWQTVRI